MSSCAEDSPHDAWAMVRFRSISEQLSSIDDREAMLVGLLETAPVPVQVSARTGVAAVNPALLKAFGVVRPPEYNVLEDEILVRQGASSTSPEDRGRDRRRLRPPWYDIKELRGVDTSGVTSWSLGIQATLLPLFDRNHVVRHVVVWGKDVTSELELRLREERSRLTSRSSRIEFDVNLTKRLRTSPRMLTKFGSQAETPCATLDDSRCFVHPEDRDRVAALERTMIRPASAVRLTRFRLERPDNAAVDLARAAQQDLARRRHWAMCGGAGS